MLFNQDKNLEVSETSSNDLDLFKSERKSIVKNHQIDLTEIDQEDKEIDEKVLEIPAFLRRQAN